MTPEQILSLPNPNEGDSSYTFERGLRDGYAQALEDVAELLRKEGANDSQAIDEAWLRSVGFTGSKNPMRLSHPDSDLGEIRAVAVFKFYDGIEIWQDHAGCLILFAKEGLARGDVRRLCAALGVKLEGEPGNHE